MSVLTTKQIMEIIPHRQPFLLIDTVEELESGVRAVAKKCVSYNEPFFGGHFPNEPVMPGVLIIEALAQTGAVAILSVEENRGKTAYFAGINSAKFKRKVMPGDVLTLETEIIKQKDRCRPRHGEGGWQYCMHRGTHICDQLKLRESGTA